MNLIQLFESTLNLRSHDVGLEFDNQEFTFSEIDRRSDRMAAVLTQRGARFGDRDCACTLRTGSSSSTCSWRVSSSASSSFR